MLYFKMKICADCEVVDQHVSGSLYATESPPIVFYWTSGSLEKPQFQMSSPYVL